jgi:hypothetical protein
MDSDDEALLPPGSHAGRVLERLRGPHRFIADILVDQPAAGLDPASLEARILSSYVSAPFDTRGLEETLRREAFAAVDKRETGASAEAPRTQRRSLAAADSPSSTPQRTQACNTTCMPAC